MNDSLILETYKQYNFPSAPVLRKIIIKDHDKTISLSEIKNVIEKQATYQLHRKDNKRTVKKLQSSINAFDVNHIVFADLVDMSKYSRQNNGCKWILLIIDAFSRKCFAITLSDKTGPKVLWAIKAYISELNQGNKPLELITDSGSEFISTEFKKFVKDNEIYHHIVEPAYHKTLGMIDRLCRTIKEKIFGYMYANNTTEWLSVFDSIVRTYNDTPHSSIGYLTPDQAYDGDHLIKQYIRYLQRKKNNKTKEVIDKKFKVGDNVRVKLAKPLFEKGYKQIWGTKVYKIKSIKGVNAVLDNDEIVKLNKLQVVSLTDEVIQPVEQQPIVARKAQKNIVENAITEADKESKVRRYLTNEGVDLENMRENRLRKRTETVDYSKLKRKF